jgi:hypothetical protein
MISTALGVETGALPQPRPAVCRRYLPGPTMVNETKFFRKQANKAERVARSATDVEISQGYLYVARAYRSQAF